MTASRLQILTAKDSAALLIVIIIEIICLLNHWVRNLSMAALRVDGSFKFYLLIYFHLSLVLF